LNVKTLSSYFQLLPVGLLFLASCVPNTNVVLLQKNDLNKEGRLPIDSVVRSYSVASFDYKIQPNDVISVNFRSLTAKEFDFFNSASTTAAVNPLTMQFSGDLVDQDGEIPFPVIGKVKVAGLNIKEIQEKLQTLADQYLEAPIVKVRLLNFRITVLGEVLRESSVTLTSNRVSMLEAIGLAGGLGELADRRNVKLIRQYGDRLDVQYLDLLDENFVNSPYFYVNQNDVLIVPPLKQRPFRKYFGQNLALVASALTLLLLTYNIINNN
jgi:polysaccharide export outer membrane protein